MEREKIELSKKHTTDNRNDDIQSCELRIFGLGV
jgi:hypothetical protein